MAHEDYDQKCNEIRARNAVHIDEFKEDLIKAGLKENTIDKHPESVTLTW